KPGLGSDTMIWGAMNLVPTAVGVILLTGILSAGISSASNFLALVGFSFINDILTLDDKPEKEKLKISRIGMFIVSLVVLVMAFFANHIFWIMYFGGTVIAGSWGLVSFAAIWSKRLSEKGAFLSMLLGFIGCFGVRLATSVWGVTVPFFLDSFFVGIYLSIIGMVVGNALAKPTPEEVAERERLFIVPDSEKDVVEMRKTMGAYKFHIAFSIFMFALFTFGYLVPYLKAVK
ncbi:hypothetical protein, partial [uncultured Fretibacterium sp.]|uniref:sodium:solute symporter family transporter n=1 Tax=uncultured Fretibacterium sp. TaxID=1678694 RepID=UPI00260F1390